MAKVIAIDDDSITFENDIMLYSTHDQDCCESHFLSFKDLSLDDFEGLDFDLNGNFFERITDFGIALLPVKGHPVRVPGYGYNNGYYSSNMTLCLQGAGKFTTFDITECQVISG